MDKQLIIHKIIDQIKTVYDPEIPVDVYELGLIYRIDFDDSNTAYIDMTLTSPMCPVADSLPMEVQQKVTMIDEVQNVELQVVFEPKWDKSRMSEEAKLVCDIY